MRGRQGMKKKAMVRSYSMSKKKPRGTRTTTKDPKTGTRTTKTYKKTPGTPSKGATSKGTTTTKTKDGKKTKVSMSVQNLTPAQAKKLGLPPLPSDLSKVKSYSMSKSKGRKGLTKAQKTLPKKIQKAIAKKKGKK